MTIEWVGWDEAVAEAIAPERTLVSPPAPGGFTLVQLNIGSDGDFHVAFHLTISGEERTLPEVEDFLLRVRSFIDAEPVLPLDTA